MRVDLTRAASVVEADIDAIVAATDELLAENAVKVVQLDGRVLRSNQAPDGLGVAILSLEELAGRYGKELIVSPI